jgi:hypothetical protein
MMCATRVAGVVLVAIVFVPGRVSAQRGGDPDSTRAGRRMTAEEYQAMRRQYLEMRRSGLLQEPIPRFGSAIVGAPGFAGPGDLRRGRAGVPGAGYGPGGYGLGGYGPGGYGPGGYGPGGYGPGGYGPGGYGSDGYGPDGYGPGGYGPGGYGPGGYGPGGYGPGGYGLFGQGSPAFGYPYGGAGGPWSAFGQGFNGITEFGWTGWGWAPLGGNGWWSSPGTGYSFAPWAGAAGSECARIQLESANGSTYEIVVAVRSLGLADPADLDLAIDERLSRGLPVDLIGVDGRRLRIEPGTILGDMRTQPCGRK